MDPEALRDAVLSWFSDFHDEEGGDVYYRTESRLDATDVGASEIASFNAAPLEGRRRMFAEWCRRTLPSRLAAGERLCARCGVRYTRRAIAWREAGFCSKVCWRTDALSR